MTITTTEAKPDALATAGASKTDIDAGQSFEGAPKAPAEPSNEPPKKPDLKEGKDETFSDETPEQKAKAAEAKVAADKAAADKAEADKKTENNKRYITLDDPAGQGAIEVLKEAGVSPEEADGFFAKAIQSGDLKDIDWVAVEAKIGKAKTFLVRTGVEAYHGNELTKTNATVAKTHEIFGGADNFDKVKAWAQEREKTDKAFNKQVDTIRELLNEGGLRAETGARELLRLYNTDGGTKGLSATKLVTGDGTGTVIGTPLTRADYLTELHKAHDRGAKPHEISVLDARRKSGISAGI